MKLPNFKRLYEQDYKSDYKDLVRQLAISFNSGLDVLYEALNRKLTLRENISCSVKEVTLTVTSDGIPKEKTTFTIDNTTAQVDGCQVIKATCNEKTTTYPTGGIFITFVQTNSGVEIRHVAGLPANNNYTLRVVAYYQ